jgi:DNA-binding beta-propeller fold protein YncE
MSRKSCKLTSLSRSCVVVCILLTLLLVELPFNESHAATTQGILGTITRPGFLPSALALDETRNRLFIFDDSTKSIFIYDATTFAEVGSVATTLGKCYSMVIDESLGKLYAGYYGYGNTLQNNIAVIDTAGGTLLKYLLSKGDNNLIKDETQDIVYVSYDGGVSQINATTDSMTAISGIWGNLYTSMAINPQTHELFVANYSQNNGNLFIVNPSSLTVWAWQSIGVRTKHTYHTAKGTVVYASMTGIPGPARES